MKHVNRTITILVFIFLYIPMIVLAEPRSIPARTSPASRALRCGSMPICSATARS